jgi:hypothetical protein
MHNQKQAYKEKVDAEMKEWEAQAALLKAKGNNMAADAKVKFEKHLHDLEQAKTEFLIYVDRISDKADDAWDSVKDEAESNWDNFKGKVSNLVTKYT